MANEYELSSDGQAAIEAVDGYLVQTMEDGRPIEALIATRQLSEISNARAKEAARAATEGAWSWTDVGLALGVSRQAAHEKLRGRIQEKFDNSRAKLEQGEQAGHAKIAERAQRGRDKLDRHPSAKTEVARQRLAEKQRKQHERLSRDVQKAREEIARAEQRVRDELDETGAPE